MSEIIPYLTKYKKFKLLSTGYSMLPLLYPQDILYFRKISFTKFRVNDLAFINKRKKIFTHRVVYKTKKYLVSKGDNNPFSDGRIHPEQVLGKVSQVKRNGQTFNPEDIYLLQSTQYFQEIIKIKKAFEKEKINVVFLKGLPLHLYFEKTYPRRIYADCDVLIDKKDQEKADLILRLFDYRKADTSYSKIHRILKDKPTEFVYSKMINKFPVIFDVHLEVSFLMNQLGKMDTLYPQKLIDRLTQDFLETKKTVTVQNEKFLILNSEFLFLYLSLHIFHHNFRGIFRLEFLDKVIRKAIQIPSPLGNPCMPATPGVVLTLTEKILKYRLQNFVYPVFLLLKKYYQTPLPQYFLNSIKPDERKLNNIKRNIVKVNIFDNESKIQAGIMRFKNLFFLSPNPLWKRLLIVFNIQVIYSVFWVMIFLVKRSLVRSSKSS